MQAQTEPRMRRFLHRPLVNENKLAYKPTDPSGSFLIGVGLGFDHLEVFDVSCTSCQRSCTPPTMDRICSGPAFHGLDGGHVKVQHLSEECVGLRPSGGNFGHAELYHRSEQNTHPVGTSTWKSKTTDTPTSHVDSSHLITSCLVLCFMPATSAVCLLLYFSSPTALINMDKPVQTACV